MTITDRVKSNWGSLPRPVRWAGVASVGGGLVVVGLIFLVLPGPGIPLIALGLVILATEFVWAEVMLARVRRHASTVGSAVTSRLRRSSVNH